ncbi:MAG: CHAT domain-containing protein [Rubrivivax sp.]|nr:CHAT domain-containing protein [Rubrivivax sp.]
MSSDARESRRQRINEGVRVYRAGRAADAARLLEPLLGEFSASERDTPAYAGLCFNLAAALAESGRLKAAQGLFATAAGIYQQLGDAFSAAEVEFNLGNIASYANHRQATHDHFQAALKLARGLGTPQGDELAAGCMLSMANHLLGMGVVEEARPWLQDFEALPASVRDKPELRWSYLFQQAKLHEHGGDSAAARRCLSEALALAEGMGDAAYVAQARGALATLTASGGAPREPPDDLRAAHAHARAQDSPVRLAATFDLAKALADAGQEEEAETLFDECLAVAAQRRSRLDLAERYHVMEQTVPIAQHVVARLLAQGRSERAFEVSEQAQGRAILDLMFRHQTRRQGGRDIRCDGAGRLMLASPTLAEVVEGLAAAQAHLIKLFRLGNDAVQGWFVGPQGLIASWDASAAQPVLGRVLETLMQMMGGEPDAPADAEAPTGARSGASGRPLRQVVRGDTQPPLAGWPELQHRLAELATALLPAAVRRHLARGRGRLVIVPHSALFHVPFGALPLGRSVLGQRWELTLAPSAGCWLQLDPRRDAEAECLPHLAEGMPPLPALVVAVQAPQQVDFQMLPGVADSLATVEFGPLDGTLPEAQAVLAATCGTGLLGAQARKASLLPWLRHTRILHLATHGYWHVLGENSFVVLAGSPEPPGANALFARDVMEQPLQAELVVLSACQTGLGAPHPDSYIGLPQAFTIAGARAVLASLWPVDDLATLRLMKAFYAALGRGVPPAAALQAAQRAMRARPDTRSGVVWAAFQFLGWPFGAPAAAVQQGAPASASTARPWPGPVLCGGDFMWTDGQPGQPFPMEPLESLRLKWNEAAFLTGKSLRLMRKS